METCVIDNYIWRGASWIHASWIPASWIYASWISVSWIHASHYGCMHHVYMHHGYMHHGYGGTPKLLVSYILEHISDGVEIFREFHTMSNLSVSFNAIIDTNIRQFSAKVGPKSISFLLTR